MISDQGEFGAAVIETKARRLRGPAIVLLAAQALLPALGFGEFLASDPPSVLGIAVSITLAVAWIALAAWSGWEGWRSFLVLAGGFWLAVGLFYSILRFVPDLPIQLPGYPAWILLAIVLGPSLHGLTPLASMEPVHGAYAVIAVSILAFCLLAYASGRVARVRRSRWQAGVEIGAGE